MLHKIRLIFILLFCHNILLAHDDTQILLALDYELEHNFQKSAKIYTKLYQQKNDIQYLQKAISQNMLIHNYQTSLKLCLENIDKNLPQDERYYRLAIVSALQLSKLEKAFSLAKKLLKKYNNSINYEILANVYYAKQEYKTAIDYFESAYAIDKRANTLLSLVNILYSYLDQKQKATSYLETFIRLRGCNYMICNKLITFYREQQNLDGMISILKMQYKNAKQPLQIRQILDLLVATLTQKDINLAIEFLEQTKVDNSRLLLLYGQAKKYKKALILVKRLYRKTKDKALLGQIAILRFEMAKDKKAVMKHIIANFEIALKATNNANYKNYYGYLLIDYDIDIKKGLKLVQEAMESYPTNLAYIDSVAWGYYKLNDCNNALKYIQKVVNQVGLEDNEVKLHWEAIKRCYDSKN